MDTQQLLERFSGNHAQFSAHIQSLTEAQFNYSLKGKWTAGQQLKHVYLTLTPITAALQSKEYIASKFGLIDRPVMTYEEVVQHYTSGLANGGKSPERFLPEPVHYSEAPALHAELQKTVNTISTQLQGYTNEELDTLVLPHPFLGKLTIRELMYVMTDHALLHLGQVKRHVEEMGV